MGSTLARVWVVSSLLTFAVGCTEGAGEPGGEDGPGDEVQDGGSDPGSVGDGPDGGGGGSDGGSDGGTGGDPTCDAVALLPQGWRPVASVSTGALTVLAPDRFRIDASAGGLAGASTQPFVYLDLEGTTPAKVAVDDVTAFGASSWDLALKRYVIRANGGTSGPGGVEVMPVAAASLASVTAVPSNALFDVDRWANDNCEYVADPIGGPLTTFSTWFTASAGTISPRDEVFLVRTRSGTYVALEVVSYYAEPGNAAKSGVYEIAWKRLPQP